MRPLPGRTVVAVAGRCGGVMEILNGLSVGGRKRNMEILGRRGAVCDEREGRPCTAELAPLLPASSLAQASVSGHGVIEGRCAREVSHADPEVVDAAATADGGVDDCLGAVPVGVAQERSVVAVGVLRALPWFAVVLAAGADTCPPERCH